MFQERGYGGVNSPFRHVVAPPRPYLGRVVLGRVKLLLMTELSYSSHTLNAHAAV